MAYIFKKIDDLLGQPSRASDALLNPQSEQGPKNAEQPQNQTRSSGSLAIDSGSSADVQRGNKAEQGMSKDNYTKISSFDPSEIIRKNQNAASGDISSGIKSGVAKTQDDLQAKANDWVAQSKPKYEAVTDTDINQVTDDTSFKKIQDLLGYTYQDPGKFAYTKDHNFDEDVSHLKTDAGTRALLKQKGGENYTQGMAGIDSAIFRGSDAYKQQIKATEDAVRGLNSSVVDTQEQANKKIEDSKTALDSAKSDAKNRLGSRSENILGDLAAKAAAANTERQALREAERAKALALISQNVGNKRDIVAGRLNEATSEAERKALIDALGKIDEFASGDLSRYIAGGDNYNVSSSDVADESSAAQFNKIMSLLGRGDQIAPSKAAELGRYNIADNFNPELDSVIADLWAAADAARNEKTAQDSAYQEQVQAANKGSLERQVGTEIKQDSQDYTNKKQPLVIQPLADAAKNIFNVSTGKKKIF
jgi:hypothetical protein